MDERASNSCGLKYFREPTMSGAFLILQLERTELSLTDLSGVNSELQLLCFQEGMTSHVILDLNGLAEMPIAFPLSVVFALYLLLKTQHRKFALVTPPGEIKACFAVPLCGSCFPIVDNIEQAQIARFPCWEAHSEPHAV